ncbi:HNH endonuclease [Pantoea agglomerans]|uniref:HNH endonuclease n=1 Tax=Enterobacter agglomerans TaxID=549 RepID=A0ACC5RM45_ENTAG|nr:HNH endonuclease signature motif containing protein [Pantoea agglomerans]MBK4725770.1 HNH endonuclease [Pantoea agglomerans]
MSGLSLKYAQQSRRTTILATATRLAQTEITVAAAREEIKRLYPNVFADTNLAMQPVHQNIQQALSNARLTLMRNYKNRMYLNLFNYAMQNNDLNAFTSDITCQAIMFMVKAVDGFNDSKGQGTLAASLFQRERQRLEAIHQRNLIAANGAKITPAPVSDTLSQLLYCWEPTYVGQYDRALRKRCREMALLIDNGQLRQEDAVATLINARAVVQTAIDAKRMDASGVKQEELQAHMAEESAKAIAAIEAGRPAAEQREAIRQESLRRQKAEEERLREEARTRLDQEQTVVAGKVRELNFDKNGVMISAKFATDETPVVTLPKDVCTSEAEVLPVSEPVASLAQDQQPVKITSAPRYKKPTPAAIEFARQEQKFAEVKVRPHQARFRVDVFDNCGGRCVISGDNYALQAAHIVAWSEGGKDSWDNGLLLRSDLHIAFDQGLIAIDPATMRVHVKPSLSCQQYDGVVIAVEINTAFLVTSWQTFLHSSTHSAHPA